MQKKIGMTLGAFLILILIFTVGFSAMNPPTNTFAKKTAAQLRHDKAEAKKKAALLRAKQQSLLDLILENKQQKALLNKYKDKSSAEYRQLNAQVAYIKQQQINLQADIDAAQRDLNAKTELLQQRIRVMYENSSFSYLQTVFESKGLLDFIDRTELIKSVIEHDQLLMDDVKVAKRDLSYKLQAKEEQKVALQTEAAAKQKYINQLDISQQKIAGQILAQKTQLAEYQKQEDAVEAESKKIDQEIKFLTQNDGGSYTGGTFIWPIPGGTHALGSGSTFGMRLHPIFHTWRMHSGVDIHASMGTTIVAVGNGTVLSASYRNGYGNTVVINHGGGITTLYAHCSKLLVSAGEGVKAGETIAKAGSTGWSTGAHLHFEVRKNGTAIDPMKGWIG